MTGAAGERAEAARPPRVTVGLPVFNGERYLSEAIESVLAQTFEDFEVVVSDNASTDGTAEIARRYAERDARVRYVRNATNVGPIENQPSVPPLQGRVLQVAVLRRSLQARADRALRRGSRP